MNGFALGIASLQLVNLLANKQSGEARCGAKAYGACCICHALLCPLITLAREVGHAHRTLRIGLFGTLDGDKSKYAAQYIHLQKPAAGLVADADFYLVFFKLLYSGLNAEVAFNAPGTVLT
jgi:hypothetical protein